ncbi:UNVERIFIED_CONTAM: Aldehyde dehydrogenase family 3 member F1 [Sesamum angustifolium]|uniref:Aldehyde dehydrogenase n=1 Tax=Sesamum angustifolium TaxID=2727405 RepID=A0AAW2KPE7_9LAMI
MAVGELGPSLIHRLTIDGVEATVGGLEMEGLEGLRRTFRSGRTRGIDWRKSQLLALVKFLEENEAQILEALEQDLGKHPVEAYRDEIGFVKKSAEHSLQNIKKWMAPKKGQLPLVLFPSRAEILPEPLGTVLIIGSWNFPCSLTLDPLIGAISAGNTVVIKPSELAPACSSLLCRTIPCYLDSEAIKIIEGGSDVGEQLLQHPWDKIFFTGSPRVGRIIMSAAAKHLTPVTLELGGKCPVILDSFSDSDFKVAMKRIASGKWGSCAGQACIGIDYVLVQKKFASLLDDRADNFTGSSTRFQIMTEEIFGPLLPIITLDDIEESIDFINARPKPLTIYAFTKNGKLKEQILQETSSGSVLINDTLIQFICDGLPFGGVGASGFGRYHGKYSFDTFSHEKPVLHRTFFLELEARHPPWNEFKMDFIRLAYKFDYIGLLFLLLGLRRMFTPNRSR